MSQNDKLHVVVHYVAAGEPFKEHVDGNETVGQLKQRVLVAFGLTEGQATGGSIATYTLYNDKTPLEDPNQTLSSLAGDKKVLQIKLTQQLTQG